MIGQFCPRHRSVISMLLFKARVVKTQNATWNSFFLSHCNYLIHPHFVHLSVNHYLPSLFSCASFSFSSSFPETPNWKYRYIKPTKCYIFHTHYFLSHWFFWITIISIITTFCNFLNIIKLYRREQRELSLVWPCHIWPLPQEHLRPRPLPDPCLSSSFSSSFSPSHHFLQVWGMVAHSHQNY